MKRLLLLIGLLALLASACSSVDTRGTIAELRKMQIEISEERIEGGLDKAMASYQRFLEETEDTALIPEAIRRLADLKVEKEYGLISAPAPAELARPAFGQQDGAPPSAPAAEESDLAFESRATESAVPAGEGRSALDDLERSGPREAIVLYRRLLDEYPQYQRNDQVLYQMSRSYEELGRIEEALQIMDRLVREYPDSRYLDEVQFRRAEYFFTHRQYLEAEDAYRSIVALGVGSSFYQLALYKLGWTFYKQELYEDALHQFIALLDYQASLGTDFEQDGDEAERKRIDDTLRVISLGFSYLGGAEAVVDYFTRYGQRAYEDSVYGNLAEYYFSKRRYSDAVATYSAFVSRNAFHAKSPLFHMRVIEINTAGGFPSLVIEAKKSFAEHYGLTAEYWQHFEPAERPEVIAYLKTNLTDLANHYHALYQNPKRVEEKPTNFAEALHWYREFLASFPQGEESPAVNYLLADLLLENRSFIEAALEYEKTAYRYPLHEQSAKAGYAAVYAYRQHLALVSEEKKDAVKREVVRSSLVFAETYPEHEKAAIVLGAAADDLYALQDYQPALAAGRKLIEKFPGADQDVRRSAWLVVAHSSYELEAFADAEAAYLDVLELLPENDTSRSDLVDNLAASIYKQGELANALEDFSAAAEHFLRVAAMAPTSKIRPTAEYDAAAALTQLKAWERAATVLTGFRNTFPGHELQREVTRKIAFVYRENGQYALAADEFERIETESTDDELRREALLVAAELHEKAENVDRMLTVYRRYVNYFPRPVETNLETRNKIAAILKRQGMRDDYLHELGRIVALDAGAADERTDRTRVIAAKAALVLAEVSYEKFEAVELVKPFEVNLRKKQGLMKIATRDFGRLLDYEVGEITAAATYYLAEIYAHFSMSLMTSERPEGLDALEREEYELAIEEQAYPFEEQAIAVHESNLELLAVGVYNSWIEKSLERLAVFVPARYAKPEVETEVIASLETFSFMIAGTTPATATGDQLPVAAIAPATATGGQGSTAEMVSDQGVHQDLAAEVADVAEPAAVRPVDDSSEPTRQAEAVRIQGDEADERSTTAPLETEGQASGADAGAGELSRIAKAQAKESGAPVEESPVRGEVEPEVTLPEGGSPAPAPVEDPVISAAGRGALEGGDVDVVQGAAVQ